MNHKEKIKKYNKELISIYDNYKEMLSIAKEDIFEEFLKELGTSKEEFVKIKFEKAYNFSLKKYKNIESFGMISQTIVVDNFLLFYHKEEFRDFTVSGILNFDTYEEVVHKNFDEFVDKYRG